MSPHQIDPKTGEELPDSNELLNTIMIILGILFIIQGISLVLVWFNVAPPAWLEQVFGTLSSDPAKAAMALIGQNGLVSIVLGVWCFVSGVGMFQEQEWAWGQALVVLSLMFVNTLGGVINWFSYGFDAKNWGTWLTLFGFATSILGFFWLIFTKKRYA
ncbi:MAG: hypothetical protein ACTSU2_01680 [Promethearchaeota archaeon]